MAFENLKDDNQRLNEHTETVAVELANLFKRLSKNGIDGRAIYAAMSMFQVYYYKEGMKRLGIDYMSRLQDQADRLGQEMLARVGL